MVGDSRRDGAGLFLFIGCRGSSWTHGRSVVLRACYDTPKPSSQEHWTTAGCGLQTFLYWSFSLYYLVRRSYGMTSS